MEPDDYTYEFDPNEYQYLFPVEMVPFIDENIVTGGDKISGDKNTACYWDDWGDDIFDDWGFFFLYFPTSETTRIYYLPILNPRNDDDGVLTTQTFFDNQLLSIRHGYPVQGIFKMDITFAVPGYPFRFGAYGNMGFDGHGEAWDSEYNYTINGQNLTLYYHNTRDLNHSIEKFHIYVIPKNVSQNSSKTYEANYENDDMVFVSSYVSDGVIIYMSKTNDVREWIVNDLQIT